MKKFIKFFSAALAFALMFSGTAVHAANYTAIPGTTTELNKYLVVDKDTEIPAAEFTFTVSAGNAVEATADTVKTWAGLNPELVKVNNEAQTGKVTFTAGEAATAGALEGVATADEKYAVKTIALDFSGVNFAEPGVYRYLLTENAGTNAAITNDAEPVRTIDVYVEDNNGTLEVTGYVSYEGTVTDAANKLATDAGNTPNGAEASTPKSNKYVNKLDSADLKVTKTVTGNQGSKDQYFEFTVTVNNAGANTVMSLDMTGAETATHENTATTFAKADMDAANAKDEDDQKDGQQIKADANGSATFKVYLHHGQEAVLKGLPKGATYTVEETAAAGYTTTKTGDTGTIADADVTAAFTNNREGVIPTGLVVSITGGAALIALAGAGMYLNNRKKEEE